MKISFPYGKSECSIDIPDQNLMGILEANPIDMPSDENAIVREAIANPVGSEPLGKIVHPGEKIAIITSDITRPMPSYKVLPIVLEALNDAGIPDDDITIIFALGSHRTHTEEEKMKIVSPAIYDRIQCIDSSGDFTHLGTTANGTPVDIFTPAVNADRRICLGNIEYHYFAGYSGGAKAIMPGISTRDAIQANHSRMTDPAATTGRIEGNPVREDIEAITEFISIDFIVNVVLDEHKNICACVAGDYIKAHRVGCKILDQMYSILIEKKPDIVVVSPGGYPKDINLYQAQKALDNAGQAIRDGGAILWLASAKEGLGEKHFEEWMLGHDNPHDMIQHIREHFILGGHKAAAIAMVMEHAEIHLFSDLDASFVKKLHMIPESDAQQAINHLIEKYGSDASVLAMPYGGATLPVLKQ